jgi:hypothetical protein
LTDTPTTWDFLSQDARRQPPPRLDSDFLEDWRGLSVFGSYRSARRSAKSWRCKHGEYIAVLSIPENAPFTFKGPGHRDHWMIYNLDGSTILEEGAEYLRQHCVERVVHGPSIDELAL